MHYSYEVTIDPEDTATSPVVYPIVLATGILRRVRIFFPLGCSRTVRCSLWDRAIQILPTNQDGYYALDGNMVDADVYYSLDSNDHYLYLVAWAVDSAYQHTLTIHLDVQGPEEPDANKVMVLMNSTIDRLITLCKGLL